MIAQSSRQSLSSSANPTTGSFQDRGPITLIVENDSERRLLLRLENYWRSLRQSACGPFFEDFWPARNPVPWTDCFIACVGGPGADPAFDHIGGSITALFKPDGTNLPDREWLSETIPSRFGEMSNVLKTSRPARGEGRFCRPDGVVVLYRSILLPFVDAKREPAYMIGAVTYRVDPMPAE